MRFTSYSVWVVVYFGAFVDNSSMHFLVVVKAGVYVVLFTTNVTLIHFIHFIMLFYMCIKNVPGVETLLHISHKCRGYVHVCPNVPNKQISW